MTKQSKGNASSLEACKHLIRPKESHEFCHGGPPTRRTKSGESMCSQVNVTSSRLLVTIIGTMALFSSHPVNAKTQERKILGSNFTNLKY